MEFSHCINYLLSVSQHEVNQRFSTLLSPYHVTPAQYGVLNCLWLYDLHTPTEIAQKLQLKTTTISGILDRMQTQGLIERVLNPNDNRSLIVVLTPLSEEIRDDVIKASDQLNDEYMSDFSAEEKEILFSALRKIGSVENIS